MFVKQPKTFKTMKILKPASNPHVKIKTPYLTVNKLKTMMLLKPSMKPLN